MGKLQASIIVWRMRKGTEIASPLSIQRCDILELGLTIKHDDNDHHVKCVVHLDYVHDDLYSHSHVKRVVHLNYVHDDLYSHRKHLVVVDSDHAGEEQELLLGDVCPNLSNVLFCFFFFW